MYTHDCDSRGAVAFSAKRHGGESVVFGKPAAPLVVGAGLYSWGPEGTDPPADGEAFLRERPRIKKMGIKKERGLMPLNR